MKKKVCYIIVEDSVNRNLLDISIRETELGYDRDVAKTFDRAYERLNKELSFCPDYIFIDWNVDFLREIKSLEHLKDSQVIVYTANLNENDIVKVKLIGVDNKTGKFKLSRKALMPKPEGRPEIRPQTERQESGNKE